PWSDVSVTMPRGTAGQQSSYVECRGRQELMQLLIRYGKRLCMRYDSSTSKQAGRSFLTRGLQPSSQIRCWRRPLRHKKEGWLATATRHVGAHGPCREACRLHRAWNSRHRPVRSPSPQPDPPEFQGQAVERRSAKTQVLGKGVDNDFGKRSGDNNDLI